MTHNGAPIHDPRRWVSVGLILVVVVCLGTGVYVLEQRRNEQLLQDAVVIGESLAGEQISARFAEEDVTAEQLRFLRRFPRLEAIILARTRSFEGNLSSFRSFSRLKELQLASASWLDEQAFRDIARLEHLEVLGLNHTATSDSMLALLADRKKLQVLSLQGCSRVTDASIDLLIDLPALRSVSLGETGITLNGFRKLRYARQDLQLHCSAVSLDPDIHVGQGVDLFWAVSSSATLDRLVNLLEIPHNWRNGRWSENGLELVRGLHLSGPDAVRAAHFLSPRLVKLHSLHLPAAALPELTESQIRFVESAALFGVTSGDELRLLGKMPLLRRLELEIVSPVPVNEIVQHLRTLTSLTTVELRGAGITDAMVAEVESLPSLESLWVQDVPGVR